MIAWFNRMFRRGSGRDDGGSSAPWDAASAPVVDEALQQRFDAAVRSYESGSHADAADGFEAVIARKHDWADAHHRLGLCQLRQGLHEQARDSFVMALVFDSKAIEAYYGMALAERGLGHVDAALATLEKLLVLTPRHADAFNFQGALQLQRGDISGAADSFRQAIEVDPKHAAAHANLGYLLFRDFAEYELGAEHIERAMALDPGNRNAQCNYTMLLSHRGQHEKALDLCNRLLSIDPLMHEARLNRALVLLKLGRFDSGWDDYEARKRVRCNFVPRALPWPEWQGEALAGKTVLIHGEQGLGDEVMFASCIGEIIARAGHTVIECAPRLQSLFRRSFPRATVVAGVQGETRPAWISSAPAIDCHLPSGSLPLHFRRLASGFPAHQGYLVPDPVRTRYWADRLAGLGEGLKIGLSWRGGMQSTRRTLRSLDLSRLSPLLATPGTRFVDLQYGDTATERSLLARDGVSLSRWPEAIDDLDEAAALITNLDLVISVCTAVVHLAGALGREAWVLVPSVPEWRYGAEGDRMPWYPSVRLFRQTAGEGWGSALATIAQMLERRLHPSGH